MTYYIHGCVHCSLAAVVLHTVQLQVKLGPQTKAHHDIRECVEHAYYRAVQVQSDEYTGSKSRHLPQLLLHVKHVIFFPCCSYMTYHVLLSQSHAHCLPHLMSHLWYEARGTWPPLLVPLLQVDPKLVSGRTRSQLERGKGWAKTHLTITALVKCSTHSPFVTGYSEAGCR